MLPTIVTYTGRTFDLENPKPSMVNIVDIAYALSNVCRFGGHTNHFYSVAEHSARMALEDDLPGSPIDKLLHDSAEAYIGDITSPLKKMLGSEIVRIEGRILAVISEALDWWMTNHKDVKTADLRMMATEIRDLMPSAASEWPIIEGVKPLTETIKPWTRHMARWNFIAAYEYLRSN